MKRTALIGAALMLVALSLSFGETVTATSSPFSFPDFSGIKNGQSAGGQAFYRFSGTVLKSRGALFSWTIPEQLKSANGTITVYSLLGRSMKTFHLTSKTGSIVWKMTPSEAGPGIYIVRFAFGSYQHNLKLAVGK
jgi:hypothetical protein